MHAISRLVEMPGLQLAQLLQGVIDRLNAGFVLPDQVQVAITGDWGHFGDQIPSPHPTLWLERAISVRLALIGNDGPTGGFYYFDQVLPW